ncbi:hypothetical protein MGYG_06407 [Nannizzia gypsea CBS 118893]|uniref:EDC4-like protein pdc1 beta-propeller domain-containing protein n=1 Tax=Arthroderma gypseum (strain ATCC MYA-4604 / CBS 118893) TaxID=535722 RepID=E4UZ79_ARTGP|nr:hypothetical protein MGYG_06407 [Nannizzia gypsea CBS 118893]EFR03409.1 hypothetical protein MGYG_06407 [Nannizzia gypsea CBS 118893]
MAGPGSPADLQALLARIKPRPSPGGQPYESQSPFYTGQFAQHQQQQRSGGSPGVTSPTQFSYAAPYASSPLLSPPLPSNPPQHGSDVISPNNSTPQNDDRANLLKLLKFSQPPGGQSSNPPAETGLPSGASMRVEPVGHDGANGNGLRMPGQRNISASDILASLRGPSNGGGASSTPGPSSVVPGRHSPAEKLVVAPTPSGDATQEMLLRLLNQPPAQKPKGADLTSAPPTVPSGQAIDNTNISDLPAHLSNTSSEERKSSPVRTFGTAEVNEVTQFDPSQPKAANKGTIFSHVNPFEHLAAASSRTRSPNSQPHSGRASPAVGATTAGKEVPKAKITSPEASKRSVAQPAPEKAQFQQTAVPGAKESTSQDNGEVSTPEGVAGVEGTPVAIPGAKVEKSAPAPEKPTPEPSAPGSNIPAKATANSPKLMHGALEPPEKEEDAKKPVKVVTISGDDETKKDNKLETKNENVADNWETEAETDRIVPVYNFPLKPFVSITWKTNLKPVGIRDDGVMDIARLKKGFDQLDRSLTSATSEYIVYALAKNGGARIIRQDDGHDRQIFRSTNDRIFNVSVSQAPAGSAIKEQAFLGIGVSGSVYWTTISRADDDYFESDVLESQSLIFPPFPTSDENASGGQLKTRAKQSSRHPEFFAIGRGKSIHIVRPRVALAEYGFTSPGKVDTEKYFKEKSIKIATGKAGKDFVFSGDDTVIASLDKTGRLRFWDIRDIDEMLVSNKCDIRIPLLTLVTGSSNEKCWPTSVLFIDKQRPYLKAHALRYILVGLKQNHTLQLWDLGLGKAVQELNFPHSNESDAICSIAYHPSSGIVVVGHPTRNSIYFIHLSAPRYALPPMSQAAFIQAVTNKDPDLPKPDSTACMSGIREISFGSRGQLRSLELLPLTKSAGQEDNGLFELYVMHSRGVTCLSIKKLDLGWDIDNKIIESVDALEKGYIEIREIQPVQPADDSSRAEEGSTPPKSSRNDTKELKKDAVSVTNSSVPESPKKKPVAESVSTVAQPQQEQTTGEKPDKKKKKKDAAGKLKDTTKAPEDSSDAPVTSPVKQVIGRKHTPAEQPRPRQVETEMPGESVMSMQAISKEVQKIEQNLTSMFTASLNGGLDTVYRRFEDDRRAQDKLATIRQDEVLRLVSKTLSENVEKTLAHIVSESIKQSVLPSLKEDTASALDKHINGAVKAALPEAISKAMQTPATVRAMSELMLPSITGHIQNGLASVVNKTIIPAFKEEQAHTAERVAKDVERKFAAKMKHLESQQINDSTKIDQLVSLVSNMNDALSTIAQAQNGFGAEILKLHNQMSAKQEQEQEPSQKQIFAEQKVVHNIQPSATETELTQISQLMEDGRYEEASIKWLQSSQQPDLFNNLFVKYNPSYLASLSPVVALSVSAAVSSSMDTHIMERLNWLQQVLRTVNISDPTISEIAPRIMEILIQRLEALFVSIAQKTPNDPILHRIPPITQWAAVLRDAK